MDLAAFDSLLTEEERDIRDTVRRFAAEQIRPHVAQWYADGTLPARELARECGRLGLLGMHLDGYGCAGTGAVAYGLACFELESADSGVRSLVSVQGSLAMYAIRTFGSEAQRERWLPAMAAGTAIGCFGLTEPDAGSDPGAMRTTARRDGADWILDGEKMWITNAAVADVAVVWARTDDGVRGFVVPMDTPGVGTLPVGHKLSLRASVTSALVLQDVRLPADAVLPGAVGLRAPLACLGEARLGIVFGALGAGYDCLRVALEYAGTREAFGRPIAGFQLTQEKLTEMTRGLVTGLLLAVHVGRQREAGRATAAQVSLAKLHSCETAIGIARTARTILAANGVTLEYPVLRHANNLEAVLTYEGTSEVHKLVVGQALTGLAAFR
ncbi:acyl-CoA dehydrogenase family protein [Micromonospora echinofusca]|uniref:glutaryl-CoA dehydrogenase (ETF) n=1 Tax=Micromonospora echinofusca TaxID=47858 RepID=A0ABS3VSG2_MICEH|nr:acyl-CoA dehydrogenase family protein [Micromonospora echinofusca]MBO4207474.1 acyl-CoA dehydrogenase [Micromonospora echinofusca]